jgi:translation initiation factor IF-1
LRSASVSVSNLLGSFTFKVRIEDGIVVVVTSKIRGVGRMKKLKNSKEACQNNVRLWELDS